MSRFSIFLVQSEWTDFGRKLRKLRMEYQCLKLIHLIFVTYLDRCKRVPTVCRTARLQEGLVSEGINHLRWCRMQTIEHNRWMTSRSMEVVAFRLIFFEILPSTCNKELQKISLLSYNICNLKRKTKTKQKGNEFFWTYSEWDEDESFEEEFHWNLFKTYQPLEQLRFDFLHNIRCMKVQGQVLRLNKKTDDKLRLC